MGGHDRASRSRRPGAKGPHICCFRDMEGDEQGSWRPQDAKRMGPVGNPGEKIMRENTVLGQDELRLAQEAAEWRLLSLLFECPTADWPTQISALIHDVADIEIKSAAQDALEQASEGLFHHTFGPGGPAP